MNGPRITAPGLPWWSPIQVLTEDECLDFSQCVTDLALVATVSLECLMTEPQEHWLTTWGPLELALV